jgi:hypothetical protein
MRFFQPEVEAVLKVLGVGILVGVIVVPVSWAYEQRRQARTWQSVACAYRMREIARRAASWQPRPPRVRADDPR